MDVVVHFQMGDMREDPAADLALVKLLLAGVSAVGWYNGVTLVNVLTVALLVNNVVPVRLEPLTAHLR